MPRLAAVLAVTIGLALAGEALAVEPDEVLADPVLEERARTLSAELRCMVCQNQSIDDSDAPLARDLRVLLRERISAGDSDSEVIDFLVVRYGNFILLKPPFNRDTALLWMAPPATLLIGGIVAFVLFRRRRASIESAPLDEAEKRRLAQILESDRKP